MDGELKKPLEWGWARKNNLLSPLTTSQSIAPDFILTMIYCSCKAGCNKLCSCRKTNMFCSSLCANCSGISCCNSGVQLEDDEEV